MANKVVGLILPSVNVHMEPEFYRMMIPGINFHSTRVMLKETTEKGLIEGEILLKNLSILLKLKINLNKTFKKPGK